VNPFIIDIVLIDFKCKIVF
jgi:Trypsin